MSLPSQWQDLSDDDLSTNHVDDILEPVPNDLWVAAACADRVVDDITVQQRLLQLGLARTEQAVHRCQEILEEERLEKLNPLVSYFQSVPADAQLCRIRDTLLDRLDRLNTYVELAKVASTTGQLDFEEELDAWDDNPWGEDEQDVSLDLNKVAKRMPLKLSSFLRDDLLISACTLALEEHLSFLQVLYDWHGDYLWPYRFTILESVPLYLPPTTYLFILPSVNAVTNTELMPSWKVWRTTSDLAQSTTVREGIIDSDLPAEFTTYNNTLDSVAPKDAFSSDSLTKWYKDRAEGIIATTGFVDMGLALIQHAGAQGIPGLDEFGEELSLFSRLVYDARQGSERNDDDWTLSQWRSLDPPSVVRAYLAHTPPHLLAHNVLGSVMPYLFVLEARAERVGTPDPTIPTTHLYDYILSCSLEQVAAIFEASKPTISSSKRIISNDVDMARLALACLYGSNSKSDWSTMSAIFECLPAWDAQAADDGDNDALDTTVSSLASFVQPTTTGSQYTPKDLLLFFNPLPLSSLSHALDVLDVHIESGEILSRWSVGAPLRWFLQSSGDAVEQRAWANRMARRAGGRDDQLADLADWEWLLEDMLKLTGPSNGKLRGAFGLLPEEEVKEIFFAGLLSTGKFEIASSLFQSMKLRLSPSKIEQLCLACSREFYDNAPSGNINFGEMKLAYDCLLVPPPSDAVTKEMEFIEATSRLCSFKIISRPGATISPIEIRLTKDRLSLVSRVLSSNTDAYKHTEVILDLVHKLGFRDNLVAEVKTLAMLADTALQAEDFERAYEVSERMVQLVLGMRSSVSFGSDTEDTAYTEASEVCWMACFQLGRQPEFNDVDKRFNLLARALELCPPAKLHDILTAWKSLQKEGILLREAALSSQSPSAKIRPRKQAAALTTAASIRARLQDFHMPSPPLLSTPDAAALASRTFRTVAANFPFSVTRGRSQSSHQGDEGERSPSMSRNRKSVGGVDDLASQAQAQASRALSRGIGWLIGADD